MEKVENRKLNEIFDQLAKDRKQKVYGGKNHSKFIGWFYKLEYDYFERESPNDPDDVEILSFDGDENFSFSQRHPGINEMSKLRLTYNIRRAYFEEGIAFFKTLDLKIAQILTERDIWMQADEKNTVAHTNIEIPNFDELYDFIDGHIKYTINNHWLI